MSARRSPSSSRNSHSLWGRSMNWLSNIRNQEIGSASTTLSQALKSLVSYTTPKPSISWHNTGKCLSNISTTRLPNTTEPSKASSKDTTLTMMSSLWFWFSFRGSWENLLILKQDQHLSSSIQVSVEIRNLPKLLCWMSSIGLAKISTPTPTTRRESRTLPKWSNATWRIPYRDKTSSKNWSSRLKRNKVMQYWMRWRRKSVNLPSPSKTTSCWTIIIRDGFGFNFPGGVLTYIKTFLRSWNCLLVFQIWGRSWSRPWRQMTERSLKCTSVLHKRMSWCSRHSTSWRMPSWGKATGSKASSTERGSWWLSCILIPTIIIIALQRRWCRRRLKKGLLTSNQQSNTNRKRSQFKSTKTSSCKTSSTWWRDKSWKTAKSQKRICKWSWARTWQVLWIRQKVKIWEGACLTYTWIKEEAMRILAWQGEKLQMLQVCLHCQEPKHKPNSAEQCLLKNWTYMEHTRPIWALSRKEDHRITKGWFDPRTRPRSNKNSNRERHSTWRRRSQERKWESIQQTRARNLRRTTPTTTSSSSTSAIKSSTGTNL